MKRFFSRWLIILIGALLTGSCSLAQFPAAPGTGTGLPETIEAIDAARVTTRILYITAHPDDESAAVLTYLARGLHADVALLSLTRGEGGQNALGPEQAPQLGLIRAQELLAATRGYGVKLYFTRAKDFGYSKTPTETEKIWGDQVLEDMVRVIRSFRPNIVINNWGGVHSGHGHHQASGVLTPKAVVLAADPKAYPEMFYSEAGARPNAWDGGTEGVQILDVDRGSENPKGYVLPLDEISPLYGKSWRQIGIDAFANHRTQGIAGFLNSPFIRRPIALFREDGKTIDASALAVPLTALFGGGDSKFCNTHGNWCGKVKEADDQILSARASALKLDWQQTTKLLLDAQTILITGSPFDMLGHRVEVGSTDFLNWEWELNRISRAIRLTSGFDLRAEADRGDVVIGEPFTVTVSYHCRPNVTCPVQGGVSVSTPSHTYQDGVGDPEKGLKFTVTADSEPNESVWEPIPLRVRTRSLASATIKIGEYADELYSRGLPVMYTQATSTSVERVPIRLVPAYTLAVEPDQTVEVLNAPHKPFDVLLRVHSYSTKPAKISVGLDVPDGLHASAPVELSFDGIGDRYAKLTVTPPAKLDAGNFTITAYAKRDDEKFSTSLTPLPSMPTILWSEPAQTIVHAFDINVPAKLHVGYISAESEPIPDALKRLGISVDLLDSTALAFGELAKFDAIVVGVRAYELRPELAGANKRLLDYVQQGGTLVVQYNRDFIWDKLQPAPYPAKIGSPTPRTTDEHSPVKFLKPDDPLLNQPNKITHADFDNWVQERGLYYWSDFDSKYTPLLAMNDPGESDLNGSLVYTRYGKGTYIYTGLAFFRELPEGVPGAYRLFVNLLSASKFQ